MSKNGKQIASNLPKISIQIQSIANMCKNLHIVTLCCSRAKNHVKELSLWFPEHILYNKNKLSNIKHQDMTYDDIEYQSKQEMQITQ